MTRASVSFILSVALHAALLTLLVIPSTREEPAAAGLIRVTFNRAARNESAGAISVAQKTDPVPEPPLPTSEIGQPAKPDEKKAPSKPAVTRSKKPRREAAHSTVASAVKSDPPRSPSEPAVSFPQEGGDNVAKAPVPSGSRPEVLDARVLKTTKKVSPEYPMLSRKRKEQGTVVLLIQIASGLVKSVQVEHSSGHPPLDESAARAVKQWAFETSGFGNEVVARVSFKFELK
ncbi:MAG: TonB family protein [Synergistaceae bacterium]|jgi:protein TonB|nr:TonB family protein [Synergistaceae bacterium]